MILTLHMLLSEGGWVEFELYNGTRKIGMLSKAPDQDWWDLLPFENRKTRREPFKFTSFKFDTMNKAIIDLVYNNNFTEILVDPLPSLAEIQDIHSALIQCITNAQSDKASDDYARRELAGEFDDLDPEEIQ